MQIVAKTEFACSKIEILEEKLLKGKELQDAIALADYKRKECRTIVQQAKRMYQHQGHTFYDIIEREQHRDGYAHER